MARPGHNPKKGFHTMTSNKKIIELATLLFKRETQCASSDDLKQLNDGMSQLTGPDDALLVDCAAYWMDREWGSVTSDNPETIRQAIELSQELANDLHLWPGRMEIEISPPETMDDLLRRSQSLDPFP